MQYTAILFFNTFLLLSLLSFIPSFFPAILPLFFLSSLIFSISCYCFFILSLSFFPLSFIDNHQVWGHIPLIPAFRRLMQENCCEFHASLCYTVISKPELHVKPFLQKANRTKLQNTHRLVTIANNKVAAITWMKVESKKNKFTGIQKWSFYLYRAGLMSHR